MEAYRHRHVAGIVHGLHDHGLNSGLLIMCYRHARALGHHILCEMVAVTAHPVDVEIIFQIVIKVRELILIEFLIIVLVSVGKDGAHVIDYAISHLAGYRGILVEQRLDLSHLHETVLVTIEPLEITLVIILLPIFSVSAILLVGCAILVVTSLTVVVVISIRQPAGHEQVFHAHHGRHAIRGDPDDLLQIGGHIPADRAGCAGFPGLGCHWASDACCYHDVSVAPHHLGVDADHVHVRYHGPVVQ